MRSTAQSVRTQCFNTIARAKSRPFSCCKRPFSHGWSFLVMWPLFPEIIDCGELPWIQKKEQKKSPWHFPRLWARLFGSQDGQTAIIMPCLVNLWCLSGVSCVPFDWEPSSWLNLEHKFAVINNETMQLNCSVSSWYSKQEVLDWERYWRSPILK